jgi:hypothetical protein
MADEHEPGRPRYSKWFWKDFTVKTQDMSTLETGAYTRLLGYARTCSPNFCTIPDDEVRLARVVGLSLAHWRRIAGRVMTEFPTTVRIGNDTIARSSPRLIDDAVEWLQVCCLQRSRRTAGQPLVDRTTPSGQPDRDRTAYTHVRAQSREKAEGRSQKLKEEPSQNGGVTAACLARLRSRFPKLDLPVIEAKMLAEHTLHPFRSLDRAMVGWCKAAERRGIDLLAISDEDDDRAQTERIKRMARNP